MLSCDKVKANALALLPMTELNYARALLKRLPLGLTNHNYTLQVNQKLYLVKQYTIQLPTTSLQHQILLAEQKVSTLPIAWDSDTRIAVFEYWDGEVYREQHWEKLINIIHSIHNSVSCDSIPSIGSGMDLARVLSTPLEKSDLEEQKRMNSALNYLKKSAKFVRYCHNDLVSENILFNGIEFRVIDFEYASFNDVYFDLGALCISLKLSQQTAYDMLTYYHGLGQAVHNPDIKKLSAYRYLYGKLCVEWYREKHCMHEVEMIENQLHAWNVHYD
ncbi:putative orphan protein [Pseudoalteromonas luteoviolacea B = ATCC 29581]|nr:putative orphan protein [Pseudoalteromonas luteoviolacea B = ATCC 29581]